MNRRYRTAIFALAFVMQCGLAHAGMRVEITDPRYFETPHKIIFPWAEIKLVSFEFEATGDDAQGKQRAIELHDQFLAKIHDLQGGAIITYVTPKGQKISNYRVKALDVAEQQKAQMALWGRIILDSSGAALINARLMLVTPPPGISARYAKAASQDEGGLPVEVLGLIDAPVTEMRIDFNTLKTDVTPLAYFLSGLARYYKGAVREGNEAKRWLQGSIDDLNAFVEQMSEAQDRGALSQAHVYLARAYFHLANADPARASDLLLKASNHAKRAADLNPYDPSVPTVQAVIAVKQDADPGDARAYLMRAAELAPTDKNIWVSLAVMNSSQGKMEAAKRQLDNATLVQRIQDEAPLPAIQNLQRQIETYQQEAR